jgi:O-antigen ligase
MAQSLINYAAEEAHADAISRHLAKTAVVAYLFFAFFGTAIPFQTAVTSIEEIATVNPFNQFLYATLYCLAGMSLIHRRSEIWGYILKEKMLFIFASWCALTLLWSSYPLVSFKRWLQLGGAYLILMSAMLHLDFGRHMLKCMQRLSAIYLIVNLAAVVFVSGARHEEGIWRGVATHKNILGQSSLICLIYWTYALLTGTSRERAVASVFCFLAFILLAGSHSATPTLTYAMLGGALMLFQIHRQLFSPKIGAISSLVILAALVVTPAVILVVNQEWLRMLLELMGRDITLTERVDLWESIMEHARQHLIVGCGFGGYWVTSSQTMEALYKEFVWFPNQAHNGYLDILNETGLIGLVLFLALIQRAFSRLKSKPAAFFWRWVFLAVIVLNLTESTFIRANELSAAWFMFSYLASIHTADGPEATTRYAGTSPR